MPKEYSIKIMEGETGMWFATMVAIATSETELPTVLACIGFDELMAQLPGILRRLIHPQPVTN